jgi:hypothetical protein
MDSIKDVDAFLTGLCHRILGRHGGTQIFLFGAKGEPFWAARVPVKQEELFLLSDALDLLEATEAHRPKPFLARDSLKGFTVAALDEQQDLYIVLFDEGPSRPAAEARVTAVLKELAPYVEPLRRVWLHS